MLIQQLNWGLSKRPLNTSGGYHPVLHEKNPTVIRKKISHWNRMQTQQVEICKAYADQEYFMIVAGFHIKYLFIKQLRIGKLQVE